RNYIPTSKYSLEKTVTTSRYVVTTNRYVVPTGRVKVPAGRGSLQALIPVVGPALDRSLRLLRL
ncbi:hypothetical protein Tco_1544307, partial [Tanacetum coccineum]